MRILHVVRGMANSSGTTHIVGPLAEAQARLGAEVSVFCVEKDKGPPVLPDSALVRTRCTRLSVPLDNPGLSLELASALNREISGFDLVHVHAIWNFPSFWAMRCAHAAGVPFVVAPQGSFDPWALEQNHWGKRLYGAVTELPLLRRAACLQALTEKEAGQFRDFGLTARSEVIPNGIEDRLLKLDGISGPSHFNLPDGCKTLLFMSRIHPKKGLDLLLSAAENLRDSDPTLRIVVAGDDAGSGYLDRIKAECAEKKLDSMLRFVGELKGDAKLKALSAADAFVLPSRSEGLPVAVLEALGAGLPVVITDECNLPAVDESDAGYVVKAESGEIASAVQRLFALEDATRRGMGERGKALITEHYTWGAIAERTMDLYRDLVEQRSRH